MSKNIKFIFLIILVLIFCIKFSFINNRENELVFFKYDDVKDRNRKLIEDLEYFEKIMIDKHQKEYRNITNEDFKKK